MPSLPIFTPVHSHHITHLHRAYQSSPNQQSQTCLHHRTITISKAAPHGFTTHIHHHYPILLTFTKSILLCREPANTKSTIPHTQTTITVSQILTHKATDPTMSNQSLQIIQQSIAQGTKSATAPHQAQTGAPTPMNPSQQSPPPLLSNIITAPLPPSHESQQAQPVFLPLCPSPGAELHRDEGWHVPPLRFKK
jgi:hypothetical protein